jgi:lipocalin-like protein
MSSSRGAEALVGVWRLEEIRDRTPDGRTGDHPDFGPSPDGFLVYTSRGHVCVQFMARNRPTWPREDDPTQEDRATAAAGYGAYAGRFDVDEAKSLVHHYVEVALIPNRVGTTLTRRFSLSGDRLTLAPLAARRKGIEIDRVLVWRRA